MGCGVGRAVVSVKVLGTAGACVVGKKRNAEKAFGLRPSRASSGECIVPSKYSTTYLFNDLALDCTDPSSARAAPHRTD